MSVCLIMRFQTVDADAYGAVMRELDLPLHDDTGRNWPDGIISHLAGNAPDGWCVVDVWDAQESFDKFFANQLGPALERAGVTEQPDITPLGVYNTYRHGRT
jgi:hypothetical protein